MEAVLSPPLSSALGARVLSERFCPAVRRYEHASQQCPSRKLRSGATVLSHDDWQALHMAAHHWASTWQATRVDRGEGTLDSGEARIDEGLMDWLGVNRSASCPEGRMSHIFGAAHAANGSLHWREVYEYNSRFRARDGSSRYRRTGAKYAISVQKGKGRSERYSALGHQTHGRISMQHPVPPWENNPCSGVGCVLRNGVHVVEK